MNFATQRHTINASPTNTQARSARNGIGRSSPGIARLVPGWGRHTLSNLSRSSEISKDLRGSKSPLAASDSSQPLGGNVSTPVPASRVVDFLVLGSGIAGLSYALKVAEYGNVAVVTKEDASEGSTVYAQGGISAVLAQFDTVDDHIYDSMVAGDFLNDREVVEMVCREGPQHVLDLAKMGANFTKRRSGELHLTQEGGHSARRVVHAEDATGREIQRALLIKAKAHPKISFFEHHLATDLVTDEVLGQNTCLGADVLDQHSFAMTRFVAPVTFLATGGAGQVYPVTTNPGVSTGDGMAMAARAGAKLKGMEFVQFHPTGFHTVDGPKEIRTFLISEAVRGEGGLLYNASGHRFMPDYDAREELAPRDIVARAIQDQMLSHGDSHVLLDISHCDKGHVLTHFPNIAAQCLKHGIDITKEPMPVAPAAHFMCGGVKTSLDGTSNVAGLFAAGEVAHTGLHGANRLASNSLLEGLVFAHRAVIPSAEHADKTLKTAGLAMLHAAVHSDFTGSKAPKRLNQSQIDWVAAKRLEIQSLMWTNAGITRRTHGMQIGLCRIHEIAIDIQAMCAVYGMNTQLTELRNIVTVGQKILEAGLARKESRGGHFNADFVMTPKSAPYKRSRDSFKRSRSIDKAPVRGSSPPRARPVRDVIVKSQNDESRKD